MWQRTVKPVDAGSALPGRPEPDFRISPVHTVLGTPTEGPWPQGSQVLYVAMGCFWGAERIFWRLPGVYSTTAGYMGGFTPNPTYEETCTGRTGHTEAVRVVYDPAAVSAEHLLKAFWENHDPTTENRQGNDVGTQYRSAVYWTTPEQERAVTATRAAFQGELDRVHAGTITTEFRPAEDAGPFYPAEDYHQQYLDKNPGGYCNHGPNGLTCPVGVADLPAQTDIAPPSA